MNRNQKGEATRYLRSWRAWRFRCLGRNAFRTDFLPNLNDLRHVRHCNIGPRRIKRANVAHHDARGRDRPHHQSNRAFDAGHVEDGETAAEAEPAAVDEPGVSVEEPGAIEQKLDATF